MMLRWYRMRRGGLIAGCIAVLVVAGVSSAMAEVPASGNDTTADPSGGSSVAESWYRKLAEAGDSDAQYNFGVVCQEGMGVPADMEKAVKWYRAAADQGHAKAQLRLGLIYTLGEGVRKSEIKGTSWIRQAAEAGEPTAVVLRQHLYPSGELLAGADVAGLFKRLLALADKDSAQTQQEIQRFAAAEQQRQAAEKAKVRDGTMTVLEKREQGPDSRPRLVNQVPVFVAPGSADGADKTDDVAAVRRRAEAGLSGAQYSLARMYEFGGPVAVDRKAALGWYGKAAAQGHTDAQYRLGLAYLYGFGTQSNPRDSRQWLERAAAGGHEVARRLLARQKESGAKGPATESIVVTWYLERALAGDRDAQFNLGFVYEHGWGVDVSHTSAIEWYEKAAQAQHPDAAARLEALKSSPELPAQVHDGGWFNWRGMLGKVDWADPQVRRWLPYAVLLGLAVLALLVWGVRGSRRGAEAEIMVGARK